MIPLNASQKSKLVSMYPELRDWLEQREIVQALKEIKGTLSTPTDHLVTMLINRIDTVKGDPGDKPIKGVDYWTPQELDQVIRLILKQATPKKGVDYTDGANGSDYVLTKNDKREIAGLISVPVVEKVIEKTETVKEVLPKSIDVSMIKGAISKKDFESTTKKIEDGMARVDGRIKLIDQRWHGGGLSRVSHDSTLSGSGTAADPLKVISGGGLTEIVVSGTINDVNVTFTSVTQPNYLVINGSWFKPSGGSTTWTWITGTITLSTPVGTGGAIWGF